MIVAATQRRAFSGNKVPSCRIARTLKPLSPGRKRLDFVGQCVKVHSQQTGPSQPLPKLSVQRSIQKPSLISTQNVLFFLAVLTFSLVGVSAFQAFVHGDTSFKWTFVQALRRLFSESQALRQSLALIAVAFFVRFFLEPVTKFISRHYYNKVYSQTFSYHLLAEAKAKAELLLLISACAILVENIVPPLISVSKAAVHRTVKSVLSLIFVGVLTHSGLKLKDQYIKEELWKSEISAGQVSQRKLQGYDKLVSIGLATTGTVLGLQAVGLDLKTLFTLGSIGSVVFGLAAREILDNLMNGLLIMTQDAFRVGDEVQFHCQGQLVEGIVINIGWARTTFRTFGREVVAIPNSVFSRTPIKNVTKKKNEWRVDKQILIRLVDIRKVPEIVARMQNVVNTDPRTIKSHLHRRVYWTDVSKDVVTLLIQFYVEANNRDAFLQIQQDFMIMFTEIVYGHGAQFAESKVNVNWESKPMSGGSPMQPEDGPQFTGALATGDHVETRRPVDSFEWYHSAKPLLGSHLVERRPVGQAGKDGGKDGACRAGTQPKPQGQGPPTSQNSPAGFQPPRSDTNANVPHTSPPSYQPAGSPYMSHQALYHQQADQQQYPTHAAGAAQETMSIDREHPYWPVLRSQQYYE